MAYNIKGGEVWAKTTIRSWLNGYGKNENASGIDYSADNFMDIAFTPAEQAALKTATVRNKDVTIIPTEGETQHFRAVRLPTTRCTCCPRKKSRTRITDSLPEGDQFGVR